MLRARPRRARQSSRGQIVILFGLLMAVVLALGGVAVDGGDALYQYRLAQNAADFASLGSTTVLRPSCSGGTVSGQAVINAITDVIRTDAPDVMSGGGSWSAVYTDEHGQVMAGPIAVTTASSPANACGTEVTVVPHFDAFLEQLIGFSRLSVSAVAKSLASPPVPPITPGIIALAPKGGHTILGGGSGDAEFIVNGSIFDNSAGTSTFSDTVDTFGTSTVRIDGNVMSVATGSFDPDYQGTIVPVSGSPNCEAVGKSGSNHSPIFFNSTACPPTTGSSQGFGGLAQITDPLAPLIEPNPSYDGCDSNGYVMQTYKSAPASGTFSPGEYSTKVVITGNATFDACPDGSPGIYYFDDGLAVCPAHGDAVNGSNVLLYAAGSGSAGGAGVCGQSNDAMTFGGNGSVVISAPTTGAFKNLVAWVARELTSNSNIGFTDDPTSFGSVTLTGVVYAHSSGDNPPNGNTPDTFESGYPENTGNCSVGSGPAPICGGGAVTVNGVVVTDKFFTGGTAQATINYVPLQLGGAGATSARLAQ